MWKISKWWIWRCSIVWLGIPNSVCRNHLCPPWVISSSMKISTWKSWLTQYIYDMWKSQQTWREKYNDGTFNPVPSPLRVFLIITQWNSMIIYRLDFIAVELYSCNDILSWILQLSLDTDFYIEFYCSIFFQ